MADECTIPDCTRPPYGRGWCSRHYQRWRTHGHPLAGGPFRGFARAELDRALKEATPGKCWVWPYNTTPRGYGQIAVNGAMRNVHRVACESAHGEPPTASHHAAHSCGNRACINPHHLSWKTPRENEADKIIHGTTSRGEANGHAKLTAEAVREIIRLRKGGAKQQELADLFGVTQPTISDVVNAKRWARATQTEGAR